MNRKILSVFVAHSAEQDVLALREYLISQGEEEAYSLVYGRIQKAIGLLQGFPDIGQYDADLDARILPVKKTRYVLVFTVENDVLNIFRVFHTSQKWDIEL